MTKNWDLYSEMSDEWDDPDDDDDELDLDEMVSDDDDEEEVDIIDIVEELNERVQELGASQAENYRIFKTLAIRLDDLAKQIRKPK